MDSGMRLDSHSIKLVEPSIELKTEFLDLLENQQQAGEVFFDPEQPRKDFETYLRNLAQMSQGVDLPAGVVPMNTYWMVRPDRVILGVSKLRHHLTPSLLDHGGHIGYYIRPSQRRQGYGGLLLALTLAMARERGIQRVRITCDTDNIGSARIIEKNGGVLSGQMVYPGTGTQISQYWIEF
jgi:predicted acetyltransferase